MTTMALKEHIEKIIKKTFEKVQEAYNEHRETCKSERTSWKKTNTRLVFPRYGEHRGEDETRISEQELRFAFVEAFNEYCNENNCNLFYSVETPTEDKYVFSKDGCACDNPHVESNGEEGQSASFDMVIYDYTGKRVCLIEFKALNSAEHEHLKDFAKLNNPNEGNKDVLRYFIEILKSSNNGTYESLHDKVVKDKRGSNSKVYFEGYNEGFRCYDLNNGGEEVTGNIIKYHKKEK